MELPELSLAPTQFVFNKSNDSSSTEAESNLTRKRKLFQDHLLIKTEHTVQTSVDLQLKDPLPVDWEQCLDLESGRMYYMNRKTLRKSWSYPKDQELDLELNISSHSNSLYQRSSNFGRARDSEKQHSSINNNMVALACSNCHLLVILSKSSPSCPNCKHVHSLPPQSPPQPKVAEAVKSLNTLTFLK